MSLQYAFRRPLAEIVHDTRAAWSAWSWSTQATTWTPPLPGSSGLVLGDQAHEPAPFRNGPLYPATHTDSERPGHGRHHPWPFSTSPGEPQLPVPTSSACFAAHPHQPRAHTSSSSSLWLPPRTSHKTLSTPRTPLLHNHQHHPALPHSRSPRHPHTNPSPLGTSQLFLPAHHRQFFNFSPQQFQQEFFSPDRRATSGLITANVVTYILSSANRNLFQLLVQNNWLVANGEWYRLLTSSFLHGGLLHLAGNMLFLHWLGPVVEQVSGTQRLLFIYLTSAVAGGWAQYQFAAFNAYTLGSSGGLAGLFAAYVMFKWRNRAYVSFTSHDTSWIAQIVGLNVVLSLLMSGSIGHWAHFGGLVAGATSMWFIGPRYKWDQGYVVDDPIIKLFK